MRFIVAADLQKMVDSPVKRLSFKGDWLFRNLIQPESRLQQSERSTRNEKSSSRRIDGVCAFDACRDTGFREKTSIDPDPDPHACSPLPRLRLPRQSSRLRPAPEAQPLAPEENLMITAIEIRGNKLIADQDILGAMKGRAGDIFSLNTLSADLAAIEALGWFAAQPQHTLEPFEGGVKIIIEVQENPVYKGVEITQNGPGLYPKGELALLFQLPEGKVINNNLVSQGLAAIERRYRDAGYTAATVTNMEIHDDGIIAVEITEGVIASIVIQGNTKTKTYVITRELNTKVGQVFNAISFRRDLERVYNLQLFEDIKPSFELNNDHKVVLTINIVEAKTGQLGFGAGYSSNEGLLATVSYSERNFRGVGQRITAEGEVGGPNPDYDLSFFNPVIDSAKTSLSVEAFVLNESDRIRDDNDTTKVIPYRTRRRGGTIGAIRPLNPKLSVALTLKFLNGKVTFLDANNRPLPPDELPSLTDNQFIQNGLIDGTSNSIQGQLAYDTRDFTLDPSRGTMASFQTSMIGHILGGDYSAFKYELELREFVPLSKVEQNVTNLSPLHGEHAQVLALRAYYGGSSGRLPLIERFEVGGQNSVRGADEAEQSGDQAVIFNGEYRFPLGGNLGRRGIFDSGTAAEPGTQLDFGNLISSIGLGIRYRIAFFGIAPLRLDYGYDLNTRVGRVVFGFGQLF